MPDIAGAIQGSLIVTLIISLAILVFAIIIWWKIFAKAGYSGALGLLIFIPIANLIVLCVLAFGRWPIYQELDALRQRVGQQQFPPVQQYQQFPPQNPSGPQYPQQHPSGPQYPPQNPSGPQYPQYRG